MDLRSSHTRIPSEGDREEDLRLAQARAFFARASKADSEAAGAGRAAADEETEGGVWADIQHLFRIKSAMRALDVGCGCGSTARQWIALAVGGDIQVTALDIPEAISRMREAADFHDPTP